MLIFTNNMSNSNWKKRKIYKAETLNLKIKNLFKKKTY